MVNQKYTTRWAALLMLACCALSALADHHEIRVEALSKLDLTYMEQQRSSLRELAASKIGRQFSGDTRRDLQLMQTLLDRRYVRPDQTAELQAMGIILGDLLAAEHDLHWVVYEDKTGRSRALRYKETDFFLYPVTMISRRWEVGAFTPVSEIYDRASSIARANTPSLPFQ